MSIQANHGSVLLLVILAVSYSHGLKIADSPSGFASADPNDPKYAIAFAASGTSLPEWDELKVKTTIITQQDGTQYRCLLPLVNNTEEDALQPKAGAGVIDAASEVSQESSTLKTPFQLLQKAETRCLLRQEGLWTYEMCFRKHLRQFRPDEAKGETFVCGVYLGDEAQSEEIKVDASAFGYPLKYVSHVMGKGSTCHLTGQERTTEIRFTCMRDVTELMITGIKEFPTCNYIVTVHAPFLCSHPEFKPKPDPMHLIGCYPLEAPSADTAAASQLPAADAAADSAPATAQQPPPPATEPPVQPPSPADSATPHRQPASTGKRATDDENKKTVNVQKVSSSMGSEDAEEDEYEDDEEEDSSFDNADNGGSRGSEDRRPVKDVPASPADADGGKGAEGHVEASVTADAATTHEPSAGEGDSAEHCSAGGQCRNAQETKEEL